MTDRAHEGLISGPFFRRDNTGEGKGSPFPQPTELLTTNNLAEYLNKRRMILPHLLIPTANNLARSREAVDFVIPESKKRVLVFPNSEEDIQAQNLLSQADVPQFTREASQNPDITVVNVPLNAWRLDSTDFQEEEPTSPAGTGAIEIMSRLGAILQRIHKETGSLPVDFELCQVAFITGEADYIKLVPPYTFSPDVDPQLIIKRVESDLYAIDPDNPHENQIKAFSTNFLKTD